MILVAGAVAAAGFALGANAGDDPFWTAFNDLAQFACAAVAAWGPWHASRRSEDRRERRAWRCLALGGLA